LLGGGGSGGHVFPGLAVAEELLRRGWRVSWAGSRRGMEERLVTGRRIPFHELAARPVVGQGVAGKVRAALTLAGSALRARALVRRLDARVVVGTGGYVSVPAVLGGRLARRPVLLIEPNAEVGAANRFLSRLAAEAAVAYDDTARQLHCPAHTTGIPVRADFLAVPTELPPSPPLRILALGGSQGARQINQLLPRALGRLAADGSAADSSDADSSDADSSDADSSDADPAGVGEVEVRHQAGHGKDEATREEYRAAGLGGGETGVRVEVTPFLDDVAGAMAGSHLVVSRAGAIALAELCAAGRPGLLVPLAIAGGHQSANAHRLAAAGAAEVLEPGADEAQLAELLRRLLADRARLEAMARSARGLGHRDAAARIADRVEHLGRGGGVGGAPATGRTA
jgi:UDP-N-acetylglucosamine--N-acetylmuramyl-(pentapeptide) pyrophosphoryl-undecaprenol N-acetylglucosamine transferase